MLENLNLGDGVDEADEEDGVVHIGMVPELADEFGNNVKSKPKKSGGQRRPAQKSEPRGSNRRSQGAASATLESSSRVPDASALSSVPLRARSLMCGQLQGLQLQGLQLESDLPLQGLQLNLPLLLLQGSGPAGRLRPAGRFCRGLRLQVLHLRRR